MEWSGQDNRKFGGRIGLTVLFGRYGWDLLRCLKGLLGYLQGTIGLFMFRWIGGGVILSLSVHCSFVSTSDIFSAVFSVSVLFLVLYSCICYCLGNIYICVCVNVILEVFRVIFCCCCCCLLSEGCI